MAMVKRVESFMDREPESPGSQPEIPRSNPSYGLSLAFPMHSKRPDPPLTFDFLAVNTGRFLLTGDVGFAARNALHRHRCASAIRALPSGVLEPVDSPPWN